MLRLLVILAFCFPASAFAAFEAHVTQGEGVARIQFLLSATTTSINAVEGTLRLPEGAIASKLYVGESVVGSWVETPVIEHGHIRFAGIIPGGFVGSVSASEGFTDPAELFSFELRGPTTPLSITDAAQYLNDGAGTKIAVSSGFIPETSFEGSAFQEDDWTPPEYVEAVSDTTLSGGKQVLLISAFDADSGIDRFEVQEGNGVWATTTAFYEVRDASGLLSISVRAYDRSGNFIETRVEGRNAPYAKLAFLSAILFVLMLVGGVLVYLKKRHA